MTPPRRTGRRPGDSGAREAILREARQSFGSAGFSGTTIRGVARAAGVDPALVHHYFGTKDELFAASIELPFDPSVVVPALLAEGMDGLGERVVRTFLGIWDATPGQGPLLALLRSAVSDERAAQSVRDFVTSSPGASSGPSPAQARRIVPSCGPRSRRRRWWAWRWRATSYASSRSRRRHRTSSGRSSGRRSTATCEHLPPTVLTSVHSSEVHFA